MWRAGIDKALFCLCSMIQCRLLKVSVFCCGQVIGVTVIICLFCFASWQKTRFCLLFTSVEFIFCSSFKKKKSGIYQTSTVHAKNTSIFIRIYVYRYLYLYLSLYSYRYSLHCTYFSFWFICCLACAPCKNFNLHLVTYGCFLCVSMCLRFCAWLHVS